MNWAQFAVQWLHERGGIYWFGGAFFGNLVLLPVVIKLLLPFGAHCRRKVRSKRLYDWFRTW